MSCSRVSTTDRYRERLKKKKEKRKEGKKRKKTKEEKTAGDVPRDVFILFRVHALKVACNDAVKLLRPRVQRPIIIYNGVKRVGYSSRLRIILSTP